MSVKEIGQKLVKFCQEGRNLDSVETLYADDVESIEALDTPGYARVTKGKPAVREKNVKWGSENEVHEAGVAGPYFHGDDRFAVRFHYDVTNKASRRRMKMDEVAVFTVKNGKVVKEEFFYDMG